MKKNLAGTQEEEPGRIMTFHIQLSNQAKPITDASGNNDNLAVVQPPLQQSLVIFHILQGPPGHRFAPNALSAARTFEPSSSAGRQFPFSAIAAAIPAACPIEQTGGITLMLLCSV